MAKSSAKKARQRRREQVRERSRQARINEAAREKPHISSYDEISLERLTTPQLRNVARDLAADFDRERERVRNEAMSEYYNVPKLPVTKRDRMFAQRPDITPQRMQQAAPRQQRLLRQQQRRINAARDRIARAKQYDALRMDRSIERQRFNEFHGLDVGESGLSDKVIQGSSRNLDILRTRNVLSDTPFLKSMSREVLMREVLDTAEKVGKPTKRERYRKREYRNVKKRRKGWEGLGRKDKDDFISYRKLRGAFDTRIASGYNRLSKKQKYMLHNATGFDKLLAKAVNSPIKTKRRSNKPEFIFANGSNDDKMQVRQQLIDFMDMVRKYD